MTRQEGPAPAEGPYGREYQLAQVEKYRRRAQNHWSDRIALGHRLVDEAVARIGKSVADTVAVDVGCSIGTFAIEMARRGFRSYGIDFDPAALELAEELAAEEGVRATFVRADVAAWIGEFPPMDIAICFDLFEHLHDDELGTFLHLLRSQLAPGGLIVYHTYPTQYDYLLRRGARLPLAAMGRLPPPRFERALKAYAAAFDLALVAMGGRTHRERIAASPHCNPLTAPRLRTIFRRAGYGATISSATLYAKDRGRSIPGQPSTHLNLYGLARPRAHAGPALSGD